MGSLPFADLETRPTELRDLTSLTVAELPPFIPPFEAAFHAQMAAWRLDGRPRTARRYTTDTNCPVPTPEERLLCLLVDLKTAPLPVVQGRLCGMGQRTAHQWIPGLLVVRRAPRRALGEAPARSVQELPQRLGVAEANAAALVRPTARPSPPTDPPAAPLVGTLGRNGASCAPRSRLRQRAVSAARTQARR